MDRNKVESARDWLNVYICHKFPGSEVDWAITNALLDLKSALRKPDADPCDECECEGCKTTEPEPIGVSDEYAELERSVRDGIKAMDDRSDFGCLKFDPIADQPSDYEIRLKAWNIAYDFAWEDVDNEFSATPAAAKKLYNFLSGQNEDVK